MLTRATIIAGTVAAALVCSAGCTSHPDQPDPAPSAGAAAWSARLPAAWGPVRAAQLVGDAVLVRTDHALASLRKADGTTTWQVSGDVDDRVYAVSGVVVRVAETGAESAVEALDPATGKPRWHYTLSGLSSRVAVTAAGIAAVTCPPPGASCTATGLAPGTGATTWQHPVAAGTLAIAPPAAEQSGYATPMTPPPGPAVLLAPKTSDATGTTVVNVATGAASGPWPTTPAGLTVRPLTDQRYLAWNAAGHDCPITVTAHDAATGATVWTATVGRWTAYPTTSFSALTCDDPGWQPVLAGDRIPAMTPDQKPELIDPAGGRIAWTGPTGSVLVGLCGDVAILRGDKGSGALSAVSPADGHTRWTTTPPVPFFARAAVTADHVAWSATKATGQLGQVLGVVDTKTGKAWTAAGDNALVGTGPGWVVGSTGGQSVNDADAVPTVRLFAFTE
jgi:hypothetical protein